MTSTLETVVEIESQGCANTTDNKDDALDKLYENHCLLSIPKDEITRIQHAVEIMVRFLLISIYENTSFSELIGSNFNKIIKRTISSFTKLPNIPYAFNGENLLKVGSYYENTKNHYPDEFDFICVLAECEKSEYILMKDLTSAIADVFHTCLESVVLNPFPAGTCIEFVKYVRLHGPAARLEFHYKNSNSSVGKRSIFVDISPASKVFTQCTIPSEMNDIIQYPEWKEIIRATGSFLLLKAFRAGHPKHETKTKISITESEQHYMLEKMSEKHKRVYRILKYMLNNDSIGEDLRELMSGDENHTSVVWYWVFYPRVVYDFPSYIVKNMMFHHCHTCKGSDTISGCVVSVVNYILKQIKSEQKRKVRLRWFCGIQRPFSVSVETMTGEKIEIADSYDSSLKITKYLKEIRSDILKNQMTEPIIPLAKKMVPVVQKHMEKRKKRKKCARRLAKICAYGVLCCLVCAFLVHVYISTTSHDQMRVCWNGTDYIEDLNHTTSVSVNTPDLNSSGLFDMSTADQDMSTSVTAKENMYCFEYNKIWLRENRANISVTVVNKIFYCGDESFCKTEDKMYQITVVERDVEQQLSCSAREFESRRDSDYQNDTESTGTNLACMRSETACLNMKEKHYLFGILNIEKTFGCAKNQPCMHTFPKEKFDLGCYISQHSNESNAAIQTEICCCDRHECADPAKDEVEILRRSIFISVILVGVLASVLLYCFGPPFLNTVNANILKLYSSLVCRPRTITLACIFIQSMVPLALRKLRFFSL